MKLHEIRPEQFKKPIKADLIRVDFSKTKLRFDFGIPEKEDSVQVISSVYITPKFLEVLICRLFSIADKYEKKYGEKLLHFTEGEEEEKMEGEE